MLFKKDRWPVKALLISDEESSASICQASIIIPKEDKNNSDMSETTKSPETTAEMVVGTTGTAIEAATSATSELSADIASSSTPPSSEEAPAADIPQDTIHSWDGAPRPFLNDNNGDAEIPEYSSDRMTLYTRNLVKTYGKRTVVNDVSIHVRQGEIVGLLGPNGAGKTTSFYMTTGLVVPNAGKVFLNDIEITKYPVAKRAKAGVGYLAQEASVFRTMSVEDNIMSVLEMRPELTRNDRREKQEELLNEFRLQKVRKNNGNQLSGGERRRCEIARCLAIDPKFIMLDEPFAGVDPIAVEDIQYIVWKLKDKNIGILITDHNAPISCLKVESCLKAPHPSFPPTTLCATNT